MLVKIIMALLGLVNGLWMLFDGIYVLLQGKYYGHETPGYWSIPLAALGIDPLQFGPVFVLIGIVWLFYVFAILTSLSWSLLLGILVSVATLWYIPFGTIISLVLLALNLYLTGYLQNNES